MRESPRVPTPPTPRPWTLPRWPRKVKRYNSAALKSQRADGHVTVAVRRHGVDRAR